MRRSAASSISLADRRAAPVTTTKEGTTRKCYLSPEYNVLPITWTVQVRNLAITPTVPAPASKRRNRMLPAQRCSGANRPRMRSAPNHPSLPYFPRPVRPRLHTKHRNAQATTQNDGAIRGANAPHTHESLHDVGVLELGGLLKARAGRTLLPNESRSSCGALKKNDSFDNLRAPPASSACYAAPCDLGNQP